MAPASSRSGKPLLDMVPVPTRHMSMLILLVVLTTACTHHKPTVRASPTPSTFKDKLIVLAGEPLNLPRVTPGSSCPITRGHQLDTAEFGGFVLGAGPAYPLIAENRNGSGVYLYGGQPNNGWWQLKTLWIAPLASPPLLVRVARLDASGGVALAGEGLAQPEGAVVQPDTGASLTTAVIFDQSENIGSGWATYPGATYVRQAGCYAFQVDGRGYSYTIVFAARPQTS